MEAVIYTRVSNDQAHGRSVEDQERDCRATCEHNGWTVREPVFTDNNIGASRWSGKDRPQWAKLKSSIRKGDVLVAWEASRPTRDLEEFLALRTLCAEKELTLCYSGRVLNLAEADDRFTGGLDALLAEREAEEIRKRVLRGKRTAAAAGRPSGKPPWGYKRVAVGEWRQDELEAPRVKETAERLIAGESLHSVLRWLKDTPGWTPVDITTLRRTISNPALAGSRVHQGRVVNKGTWAEHALLTDRQHKQLLLRFGRTQALDGYQSAPGPEPKYLLSNIAKCGVCGKGLVHKNYRNRKPLYICHEGHVSRIAEELDRIVEARLFLILSHFNPSEHTSEVPETQQLLDNLGEVEEELEGWIQSCEKGEVSRQSFIRMEKALTARADGIKDRLRNTHSPTERLDMDAVAWTWRHTDMPMRDKRRLVKVFFTIVVPPIGRTDSGGRLRATSSDVSITHIQV